MKPTSIDAPPQAALAPGGQGKGSEAEPRASAAVSPAGGESGFVCGDDLCIARDGVGRASPTPSSAQAAKPACATASVIVIDDATAKSPCAPGEALVITKRQLALNGSATIDFDGADGLPRIVQAVSSPLRPWHDQRRYSREARGLAPYQRAKQSK